MEKGGRKNASGSPFTYRRHRRSERKRLCETLLLMLGILTQKKLDSSGGGISSEEEFHSQLVSEILPVV